MASALWELSGEDGLLDAYKKELDLHGKAPDEMKPVVRITTSDTGSGGVKRKASSVRTSSGDAANSHRSAGKWNCL